MGELIRVGVLTVSDRCSAGERADESGPAIQAALPGDQFVTALYAVVPDDKKGIAETLKRWCDEYDCDVVLTTGGTGYSPTDVTPEATERVIERPSPNISQYLMFEGLKQTPFAALSRGIAGLRGRTLIVNLPGSPTGARDGANALRPLLPHLVAVLRGEAADHPPVTDSGSGPIHADL